MKTFNPVPLLLLMLLALLGAGFVEPWYVPVVPFALLLTIKLLGSPLERSISLIILFSACFFGLGIYAASLPYEGFAPPDQIWLCLAMFFSFFAMVFSAVYAAETFGAKSEPSKSDPSK